MCEIFIVYYFSKPIKMKINDIEIPKESLRGGSYVTIEGKNYCENFSQGSSETHQVLVGEDTVPDGKVSDQFLTLVKNLRMTMRKFK